MTVSMEPTKIPTIDLTKTTTMPPLQEVAKDFADKVQVKSIPHGELLKVLYFLFDMFNDFRIQFFPVRETARAMLAGKQLEGDHLDIGIRSLEWTSDNKLIVETCMETDHVEKLAESLTTSEYEKDGVKIIFHFYPDNDCITYLSSVDYEFEKWAIPQRFEEFCEKYDKGGDSSEK